MFCLVLLGYFLVFSCCVDSVEHYQSASNKELSELIDDFWQWRISDWPDFGVQVGVRTFSDRLENYTETAFTQEKVAAEGYLQRLSAIDVTQLNKQDRTSASVLKTSLQTFIDGYAYRKFGIYNYMSFLDHVLYRYKKMLRIMPKQTVKDYENILARYRHIPQQLSYMTVLLQQAIIENKTVHTSTIREIIKFLEDELSKEDTIFQQPFAEDVLPQTFNQSERLRIQQESGPAIEGVIKALTHYKNFLINEYSPHARVKPGVGSLTGGLDYYKQCLKWHISQDLTPREVHLIGLQEVERITKNMEKIIQENGFNCTVKEHIAFMKTDPQMTYNTSEEMLDKYSSIIERAHEKLSLVLYDVHDDPIQVLASPQRVSRYSGPAPGGVKATFWADVKYPKDIPKYTMTALTLHEAEPGHHLQFMTNRRNQLPDFRRFTEFLRYNAIPFNWLFNTAFVEGWALYSESLGEEMGVYTDPMSKFGKYTSEIFRAARLVVDTGIHAFGWSIEDAESYLKNYTAMGTMKIKNEVLRYVSWPGQACAYKIGQMKIIELRKMATTILGADFNLREYHKQVLSIGSVPLNVLEEHIHAWVDEQLQQQQTTSQADRPNPCKHVMSLLISVLTLLLICFMQI